MNEITMPALSDSMEQGTILAWLKVDGEQVNSGDDLVEIETDKATMTYAAPADGVLSIIAPVGSELPVGAPIARLGAGAGEAAQQAPTAPVGTQSTGADGQTTKAQVRATPIARRLADTHDIDLRSLSGSGLRGRITRRDVAAAAGVELNGAGAGIAAPRQTAAAAASLAVAESTRGPATPMRADSSLRGLTRLQQTVARRMAQAQTSVPDFQVETEVSMDAAIALRAQLKETALEQEVAPSLNDLVVKACALALRSHPLVNASYREDGFELHEHVNVGIAVAAEQALIVPVIVDADSRSLGSIAAEARRLSERARNDTIVPAELSGATFTVSNLGMYGMTAIKPIVSLPQAAILGVGALRSVLAREGADIVDRSLLTLTLSADHRILYGAEAALFLADVRALLETPLRLFS
ncbi:MAG TPA: dihydrolipoamide acetyltransferase family protein [Solirubrobacteraceae bacterium]|jgi:pyruvate dehydrogenase E2 component (dihydrolipoamide acetyltransferase)|nr:dihydrolipoamide acetyltransferase family protein [Solirubrobacteraceae bacterium]